MIITLYSKDCPKCKILEQKLRQKNIPFGVSSNFDELIQLGFMTLPVLKIDQKYLDFGEAVKWVNAYAA